MPRDPENSSLTEYLILGLVATVGVILILIGSSLQGYASKVLSDLGDALIIAAVVGAFVELRLVYAAMKRMEANWTRTVGDMKAMVVRGLRKYLPAKLVDALENQVLDPVFLREGVQIFITLASDSCKERVRGTVFLKYNVRNLSAKPQTYMVRLSLDEVFGEKSAMLQDVKINGEPMDLSHPQQGTKIFSDGNMLHFEHPVFIPVESYVYVELKGYQVMAEADVWPWYLMGVCDSLQITVNFPPEAFSVSLLAKHPSIASRADFGLVENLGTVQAAIKDIILPYQGFELRWRPSHQPSLEMDIAATTATKS